MRVGRESNQGIVFPPNRYKKIPYDMRDLERVIVEMPNETTSNIKDLEDNEKVFRETGRKLFREYSDKRIAISGWNNHTTFLYLGIGGIMSTIFFQLISLPDFIWELWFIIGLPSKSTRLNVNPLFASAGLKVNVTFFPVCRPTPVSETSLEIVFCLISVLITVIYFLFYFVNILNNFREIFKVNIRLIVIAIC